jgi:hypothetical protein
VPNLLINIPGEEGSDVGDDIDDKREAVGRQVATDVGSCHYVSTRQHTSAYFSIRQHTSAYVSIRQHTSAYVSSKGRGIRPSAAATN